LSATKPISANGIHQAQRKARPEAIGGGEGDGADRIRRTYEPNSDFENFVGNNKIFLFSY